MRDRPSANSVRSYEFWWVIGFCVFAAVRVLLFSAAFPFSTTLMNGGTSTW
jgi:hypothetical protein